MLCPVNYPRVAHVEPPRYGAQRYDAGCPHLAHDRHVPRGYLAAPLWFRCGLVSLAEFRGAELPAGHAAAFA
jgi:hypothetical protein